MSDPSSLTPHTLGAAIRLVRNEKGLTLAQLADKCGLSVSYLSDLERNRTLPSLSSLEQIAAGLDHILTIGLYEEGESFFPASPAEIEMIYALRQKNFARFMLMAGAILNSNDLNTFINQKEE